MFWCSSPHRITTTRFAAYPDFHQESPFVPRPAPSMSRQPTFGEWLLNLEMFTEWWSCLRWRNEKIPNKFPTATLSALVSLRESNPYCLRDAESLTSQQQQGRVQQYWTEREDVGPCWFACQWTTHFQCRGEQSTGGVGCFQGYHSLLKSFNV